MILSLTKEEFDFIRKSEDFTDILLEMKDYKLEDTDKIVITDEQKNSRIQVNIAQKDGDGYHLKKVFNRSYNWIVYSERFVGTGVERTAIGIYANELMAFREAAELNTQQRIFLNNTQNLHYCVCREDTGTAQSLKGIDKL